MNQIFISYRREDAAYAAGRLYDRLAQHFNSNGIFMDIDAIELGIDFRRRIEEAVGACDVLIAIIGRNWLTATDPAGQRRLDNPDDFVHLELATALDRDVHVIPALVDGASMPTEKSLPKDLAHLARRNGLEIGHTRFDTDVSRLIKGIEGIFEKRQLEESTRATKVRAPSALERIKTAVTKWQTHYKEIPSQNVYDVSSDEKWSPMATQASSIGYTLLILLMTYGLALFVATSAGGGRSGDDAAVWVVVLFEMAFPIYVYNLVKRGRYVAAFLGLAGMAIYGYIIFETFSR